MKQAKTALPLAAQYEGTVVLERQHIQTARGILLQPHCNILHSVSAPDSAVSYLLPCARLAIVCLRLVAGRCCDTVFDEKLCYFGCYSTKMHYCVSLALWSICN